MYIDSSNSPLSYEYDLCKQLYYDEIEHRERVSRKFQPTISIAIFYYPLLGYLITLWFSKLSSIRTNMIILVCGILLCCGICLVVIATYHFIRCFMHFRYTAINPNKVMTFIQSCNDMQPYYSNKEIQENMKNEMAREMLNAAIKNWTEVNSHSKQLCRLYFFIFLSMIPNITCFMILFFL